MGKEERSNKNDPIKALETELMHLQMSRDNVILAFGEIIV